MKTGINIILVDDEKLARQGFAFLVKKSGINVVGQASNGSELMHLLKSTSPDLILLDLEMPVLNGSKTLNRLSSEHPEMKVIILSKYHDEELIKNMFNRGARAFVSKNSDIKILLTAIEHVFTYGIYKENIPELFGKPAEKDGHYYRLILTRREILILGKLYESKSYEEIGRELCISARTVENHSKSIYKKIKAKNRAEFGIVATRLGLNYMGNLTQHC